MPLDLGLFSDKLRRYREQFQCTRDELAYGTGIEVARVVELEVGAAVPTGDEILILADFFKADYRFFVSNEVVAPFEQTETLFRAHGDELSPGDRWAVQELLFLCESESDLQQLLGRTAATPFSFAKRGNYYKRHGEDAARALRAHLGYSENQVATDVYRDVRKLGFHTFRRRLANRQISGLCIKHPVAGRCILVNYEEDPFRQRFTAAHEAGHAILDDDQDVVISFKSWSGHDLSEVRANTFASNFLMPPSFLRSIPNVAEWDQDKAIQWSTRLMVSTEALSYALRAAGLVSEQVAQLVREVRVPSEQKADPEIPKDMPPGLIERRKLSLERGLSSHYVALALEAFDTGHISSGRLAELLLVDSRDLGQLLQLYGRERFSRAN